MSQFKVLITKPKLPNDFAVQADSLARELKGVSGVDFIHFPLFELSANRAAIVEMTQKLLAPPNEEVETNKSVAVFVSPSALELSLQGLSRWPTNWYCAVMGEQSKNVAVKLGVPEELIVHPKMVSNENSEDSEGLLKWFRNSFEEKKPQVLVCKGPKGRVEFANELSSLGFSVSELVTYNREVRLITEEKLKQALIPAPNAIWVTSSEAVSVLNDVIQGFDSATNQLKAQTTVLTTHERITSRCKELGFAKVEQIDTGVQSLVSWLQKNKNKSMKSENSTTKTEAPSESIDDSSSKIAHSGGQSLASEAVSPKSPWMSKLSLALACLSILLLLAYAFYAKDELYKSNQTLAERLQAEKTRLAMVEEGIQRSNSQYIELKTKFDLMNAEQQEAASQRKALEEVYEKLLASRSAVSLSEIEQLTSIAQRQLFVLGNVRGAVVALDQAIKLLADTEEPSLISLRSAIELDLNSLRKLPEPNLLDLAIKLDMAIDMVDTLPALAGEVAISDMNLDEMSHGGAGSSRIDAVQHKPNMFQQVSETISTLLVTVWDDIKSLVEITHVDNPEVLQLSAREIIDVKNAVRLSLLNARLALLSRQGSLLKNDLDRSKNLIQKYFDPKSTQVSRTLEILNVVSNAQVNIELPDLARSLSALRLAKAGEGIAQ